MQNNLFKLIARDGADSNPPVNHTMVSLLVALLVLVIVALMLVGGLLVLRRRRRARKQQQLGVFDEKRLSTASSASNHRRTLARPVESIHVYNEKQELAKELDSPPDSPLPEIRITFPEEYDESGKRTSGRVVVVHIGDTGVGLEPAESLPSYQQTEGERFQSLDLERIGGLVEKARNAPRKSE